MNAQAVVSVDKSKPAGLQQQRMLQLLRASRCLHAAATEFLIDTV